MNSSVHSRNITAVTVSEHGTLKSPIFKGVKHSERSRAGYLCTYTLDDADSPDTEQGTDSTDTFDDGLRTGIGNDTETQNHQIPLDSDGLDGLAEGLRSGLEYVEYTTDQHNTSSDDPSDDRSHEPLNGPLDGPPRGPSASATPSTDSSGHTDDEREQSVLSSVYTLYVAPH